MAVIGAALVLAFVLSLTGQSEGFYERNFVWLFWLNVAVAALLLLVIAMAVVRLVLRQRRGKFGTRLLTKLAGIFALVGAAARAGDLHRVATSSCRAASRSGST